LEGSARGRTDADQGAEPGAELEARAVVIPMRGISAEGALRSESLHGVAGVQGTGTVRVGPLKGISAFVSVSFVESALPLVGDTTIELPGEAEGETIERVEPRFSAVSARSGGVRVGAEWQLGTGLLGVAGVAGGVRLAAGPPDPRAGPAGRLVQPLDGYG
jgi:hypothetical protein